MLKLFILMPAFNEEENIKKAIANIPTHIAGINNINVIVIDDGSTDSTARLAKGVGAIVLRHEQNRGVGAAMATGFAYALSHGADIVVNIDADGQFDAREIEKLVKPIQRGEADFVSGNRFAEGRPKYMPFNKYIGNKLMSFFIGSLIGEKFGDVSCGFRAYSREALLNMNLYGKFTYTQEMFLDFGFKDLKIKEAPITVEYFPGRKSRVAGNLFKYSWKSLSIIIRSIVYYRPLKFFAYPGLALLVIGFAFTGFLVWHKLFLGSYTPYKAFGFIGGGMAIFGLLMIFIGLLADILDRIRQTQEKLFYFEKKKQYHKNNNNK